MDLHPDHDHAISACVTAALENEAKDMTRADDVRQLWQAILASTQRAFSAFAVRWNSRANALLPPELLSECFSFLPFDARLTVSGVSQHWRAVALDTPALWATFRISTYRHPDKTHSKLAEMLRRSKTAPLSVQLPLTPDQEALLRPHIHRVRELLCANAPSGPLDLPMLSKLVIYRRGEDGPFALSAANLGCAAARLRVLSIQNFAMQPPCPIFPHLRELSADFCGEWDNSLSALLAQCPVLESLTVRCDADVGSDPQALFVPLPAQLRDVSFERLYSANGPSNSTLQPWAGHVFRKLRLSAIYDLSGIIQWFSASYSPQPWSLSFVRDDAVLCSLETHPADDSGHISTLTEATLPFSRGGHRHAVASQVVQNLLRSQAHFERLTACTISLIFFAPLVEQGARMPALERLTLDLDPDSESPPTAVRESCSGLAVPALRSLALVCRPASEFRRNSLEWFYDTLPRHLRTWMLYDAPRLERLSLEGIVPRRAMNQMSKDMAKNSRVYELADVVHIDGA